MVALPLEELEEDRPELVLAEDLQQQLAGHAVDQDLAVFQGLQRLAVAGDAFFHQLVVGVGRVEQAHAAGAQRVHGVVEVVRAHGDVLDALDGIKLPAAHVTQTQLEEITDTIRLQDSIYKKAGSVHGCALFSTQDTHAEKLIFVEDVGRHNAIDTIAGWMWLQNNAPTLVAARTALPPTGEQPCLGRPSAAANFTPSLSNMVFYTTGRLTSEMVMKSAQMGIPIVVSRSGMTEMGLALAQQLNLCAIGRATNKRFLCFSAPERVQWQAMVVAA